MRNAEATVNSARNRPADRRADARSDKASGSIADQASANGLGRVRNSSNTLDTNPSHTKARNVLHDGDLRARVTRYLLNRGSLKRHPRSLKHAVRNAHRQPRRPLRFCR